VTSLATPSTVDLAEIVAEVWASLLVAAEVLPVEPSTAIAGLRAVSSWSATVDLEGPERRRVTAALPLAAAHALTRHLFDVHDPRTDPAVEDVADALGELVNIVGGNVKSLMPAPSRLGLPVASPTLPSYDGVLGGCAVTTLWDGHPVVVTVHDPSAAALTHPHPTAYPQGALS
jgi:chemotaxis protein CheX